MTKAEKREAKLRECLAMLEAGQHVQNRKLETWLGADWAGAINGAWEEEKAQRQIFSEKPAAIVEYENAFIKARMLENRANVNKPGKSHKQRGLHDKAEVAYERLLELYEEIIERETELLAWFDRVADFTAGNEASLCAEHMPQVRTSRSLNNKMKGSSVGECKRQVKIDVLRCALREIENARNPDTTSENTSNRLERFLKNMGEDFD